MEEPARRIFMHAHPEIITFYDYKENE